MTFTTSLTGKDDGPLTNPDMFGGHWTSWRDDMDIPFATYELMTERTGHFDSTGHQLKPTSGQDRESSDGETSSSEGKDKTWKKNTPSSMKNRDVGAASSPSVMSRLFSSDVDSWSRPAASLVGALLGALVTATVLAPRNRSRHDEQD